MTALEELIEELRYYDGTVMYKNEQNSMLKVLNQKYSVTLRNTSESADNAKSEQSITDEELLAKIKSILNGFDSIKAYNNYTKNTYAKNVLALFKTYRTMPNSASNNSPEHSINQEQMMSQIEDIALDLAKSTSSIICDKLSKNIIPLDEHLTFAFKHFQQELKDCFKQHFKPSKSSDGQTLMEDNSVFKNSIKNSIRSKIGEIVNSSDDLSIIVEKLTELHMASIEPVFRALDE